MIPLIQWSAYNCDGSDHIIGWSGGRPIITSKIISFSEPVATTENDLKYLIHPDSQGTNFQSLFIFGKWIELQKFTIVELVTKKYFLSDY
jgi:hypothetical protein